VNANGLKGGSLHSKIFSHSKSRMNNIAFIGGCMILMNRRCCLMPTKHPNPQRSHDKNLNGSNYCYYIYGQMDFFLHSLQICSQFYEVYVLCHIQDSSIDFCKGYDLLAYSCGSSSFFEGFSKYSHSNFFDRIDILEPMTPTVVMIFLGIATQSIKQTKVVTCEVIVVPHSSSNNYVRLITFS